MLLFGVDADELSRFMLGSLLGTEFEVELFGSAEACLSRLEEAKPDIVVVNTDLPGMSGFELCRYLKAAPGTGHIPVLFLSSDDGLESRLQGYDCGGEDYIQKPYAVDELRRRILIVRAAVEQVASMRSQASDSDLLTSLLLSNMDEYAVLIKFMRSLNECESEDGIAEALLVVLGGFRLDGAVQIRLPWTEFTLSEHGRDRPLEVSVMNHVRALERIFQFRKRCAYNYDTVTLLVNDMPWEDMEVSGRLRDHLAIAVEMADARLQSLAIARQNSLTRSGIGEIRDEVRRTVGHYINQANTARHEGSIMTGELFDELAVAFAHLGLSKELEEDIEKIVRSKAESLIAIFDTAEEAAATLLGLGERLEKILD